MVKKYLTTQRFD